MEGVIRIGMVLSPAILTQHMEGTFSDYFRYRELARLFGVEPSRVKRFFSGRKEVSDLFTKEQIARILVDNGITGDFESGLAEGENLIREGLGPEFHFFEKKDQSIRSNYPSTPKYQLRYLDMFRYDSKSQALAELVELGE